MFSQRLKRERREDAIRSSLIMRVKEAVQSVVQPGGSANRYSEHASAKGVTGPVLGHCDNTNALCNIIEAVFVHGLRDSLGERMSSLLGSDPDRMPVPNFWPVLLVISHRDIIEQVSIITRLPLCTITGGLAMVWWQYSYRLERRNGGKIKSKREREGMYGRKIERYRGKIER